MNASSSIGGSRRARDPEPRVAAALALVTELRARGGHIATVITQMEKLCDGE